MPSSCSRLAGRRLSDSTTSGPIDFARMERSPIDSAIRLQLESVGTLGRRVVVLESVQILRITPSPVCVFVKETSRAAGSMQSFHFLVPLADRDREVIKGRVQWCRPAENCFHVGALIHGQRGRDLPRIFGNLEAVHVDIRQTDYYPQRRIARDTLRCEQELMERFLPSGGSTLRQS